MLTKSATEPGPTAPSRIEPLDERRIRRDHPRLFFNADMWPAVRERALTVKPELYAEVKAHAAGEPLPLVWSPDQVKYPEARAGSATPARDWGNVLMSAALAFRIEPTAGRLKRIREMLFASLDFYHAVYATNRAVDWLGYSRIMWLAAVDWVWDELAPAERRELAQGLFRHLHDIFSRKNVPYRNLAGHRSGYYGEDNIAWFAGLVFFEECGADNEARHYLRLGYDEYQKLFLHRAGMVGNRGGAPAPCVAYSYQEYPMAEWNFLHTWQSATGEDLSRRWDYISLFPNYLMWNLLPDGHEYGYGDSMNYDARLAFPTDLLYSHLSHCMHFYAGSHPERAALAAYLRAQVGGTQFPDWPYRWSIHPFLTTNLEKVSPRKPDKLPPAQEFAEKMRQVFMRSGDGPDDTCALFVCQGATSAHSHYDANHFTIYRKGFLALDSGTRQGNTDGLQNYFAQTVAHNCILISMPGEAPSPYWNGPVHGQDGGQYKRLGSRLLAFETGDIYTYAAGDATAVYRPEKCREAVRQFVFLPPCHFVIFDRVISTRAEYGKRWLLHHANEPVFDGATWQTDQDRGRLFCRTLLPDDAVHETIGGPGREFVACGVNYPLSAGRSDALSNYPSFLRSSDSIKKWDPALLLPEVPELMGRWRVEVKPGSPRTHDIFLHVIRVGDRTLETMDAASASLEDGAAVLRLADGERDIVLSFNVSGPVGGRITVTLGGKTETDRALTATVQGR